MTDTKVVSSGVPHAVEFLVTADQVNAVVSVGITPG